MHSWPPFVFEMACPSHFRRMHILYAALQYHVFYVFRFWDCLVCIVYLVQKGPNTRRFTSLQVSTRRLRPARSTPTLSLSLQVYNFVLSLFMRRTRVCLSSPCLVLVKGAVTAVGVVLGE
jgi:hypothetical protein